MKKWFNILIFIILFLAIGVNASGSINVSSSNISMDVGDSKTFKINASNAAGVVEISSSNTSVATVDVSKYFFDTSLNNSSVTVTVSGKSVGTTTIKVLLKDVATFDEEELKGTKTVNITVNQKKIVASSISLNKTSASIKIGEELNLVGTIKPDDTENKTITWSSSNNTIATVSNGKVVGKKGGVVTITAKTDNGKKATCKVTVVDPNSPTPTPTPSNNKQENKTDNKTDTVKEMIINQFEIVGYDIDFDKTKTDYNIDVMNSVNKIYIIVQGENVTVEGDKEVDIKDKDKITVKLTDDNGTKEYVININRIENKNSEPLETNEGNKTLIYILLFFVLACCILSFMVIKLVNDKKKNMI